MLFMWVVFRTYGPRTSPSFFSFSRELTAYKKWKQYVPEERWLTRFLSDLLIIPLH